jgi:hypothetical protein
MLALGIDPGMSGGLAVVEITQLDGGGFSRRIRGANEIPVVGDAKHRQVNVAEVRDWLSTFGKIDRAFMENARAMPSIPDKFGVRRGMGATSSFNYGRAVGRLETVVLMMGIPLTPIEATSWKKFFSLRGSDKEASRQLVLHRYPSEAGLFNFKYHHGRAEAVLVAEFGAATKV